MANERKRSDALEILDRRIGDDPEMRQRIDDARLHADVAQQVHDARTKARLSQQALADKIGTTQSVISRIEDADYKGHSLATLRRVAAGLGCRLHVRLIEIDEQVAVADRHAIEAHRITGRKSARRIGRISRVASAKRAAKKKH